MAESRQVASGDEPAIKAALKNVRFQSVTSSAAAVAAAPKTSNAIPTEIVSRFLMRAVLSRDEGEPTGKRRQPYAASGAHARKKGRPARASCAENRTTTTLDAEPHTVARR